MLAQSLPKTQYCGNCRNISYKNFRPVVNLKKSGLIIYVHESGLSSSKRGKSEENTEGIILCNSGSRTLNRFDYIVELCQYRTKCFKCRALIRRIRDLIDNISIITKNEILGVCEYCKRSKLDNKCKRCEYMVNKFIKSEIDQHVAREEFYVEKLSEVRQILLSLVQGHIICKHNVYLHTESEQQLEKLLNTLNLPVFSRQPDIDIFPDINLYHNKSENQIIHEEIEKLDSEKLNEYESSQSDSSESTMRCICKYLKNRKDIGLHEKLLKTENVFKNVKESLDIFPNEKANDITKNIVDTTETFPYKENVFSKNIKDTLEVFSNKENVAQTNIKGTSEKIPDKKHAARKNTKSSNEQKINVPSESIIRKEPESPILSDISQLKSQKSTKTKYNKTKKVLSEDQEIEEKHMSSTKGTHGKNKKKRSSFDLMLKMIMKREKELKQSRTRKISKVRQFAKIEDLPVIKIRPTTKKDDDLDSESVVDCQGKRIEVHKMIKGVNMVTYDPHYTDDIEKKLPLLFKVHTDCNLPNIDEKESLLAQGAIKQKGVKSKRSNLCVDNSGIFLYRLSNPEFIDKGWTQLPTIKVMRRINIYKMITHSKFNWFENHKEQTLFYDSQEKFAETYENGCGKWFYKDGSIALDYYNAAEINVGKRCIIYSCREESYLVKKKPITILACFDDLGNGIVYDHHGYVRLKYNQSEGLIIDPKIGPPSKWKWHTLNDPPVLHPVFTNTYVKDNPCFTNFIDNIEHHKKNECEEMTFIELENLMKEKAAKLKQKFKPFQIKMKALKINDYFSLRIIDQANIYILFRCGRLSQKFNIGMVLKSNEIIGTEVAEISDVGTSYDRQVPISNSISDIQKMLAKAQKVNKNNIRV